MKTKLLAVVALALLAAAPLQPALAARAAGGSLLAPRTQTMHSRALKSVIPLAAIRGPAGPDDAPSPAAVAAAASLAAAAADPSVAAANPAAAAAAAAALYGPSDPDAIIGTPEFLSAPIASLGPNTTNATNATNATARAAAARPPPLTILTVPGTNVSGARAAAFQPLGAATVTVYEHCWFGGASGTAAPGNYPSLAAPWNDFISSLRVPAGIKVLLREHANYGGRGLTITGPADVDCLNRWNFNDITSSMQITVDGQQPPGPNPPQPPPSGNSFADELLGLVNAARARAGLRALTVDGRLNQAAQVHSNDMARNNFFDHKGSDGSMPWDRVARTGYRYSTAGENIAGGSRGAQAAFNSWMNSQGHRENILRPQFTQMGGACADGGKFGVVCTQVFATPL